MGERVSWAALGWASQQRMKRVADKMVLIALADRHNEEDDASWPSIAWLADFCCIDRKTVITSLDRLETEGLIIDTGLRTGKTKQIKVYRLALNSPKNGIPKTELLGSKSTTFSVKQSQKRDTEPYREPITPVSSNEDTAPASEVDDRVSLDELQEAWNDTADSLGLPKVVRLSPARRRKAAVRIREHTFQEWADALAAIRRSKFLCGDNSRGWRANFDWLLRPETITKLLEGQYDDKATAR